MRKQKPVVDDGRPIREFLYERPFKRERTAMDRKVVAAGVQRLRARLASFVDEFKTKPCHDCGNRFPTECMDFDHARGKKLGDVSAMVLKTKPIALIKAEIEKCEVVCANCHRIRTSRRGNYRHRRNALLESA